MAKTVVKEPKKKPGTGIRWRLWLGLAAAAGVCVSTAMAARTVVHYVHSDPQFVLSREDADAIRFEGLQYASRSKVQRVFAPDFERSILAVPLAERRRRLLAIDWIADASVSRVWPDKLVVRVRERKPVAFVNFPGGSLLIDRDGVFLEPPQQVRFNFPVLTGVGAEEAESSRARRVRSMLRLLDSLGANAKDVSEVVTTDPENMRMIAQLDKRPVELILGDTNFSGRYRNFLSHYPEMRKRYPEARTFDLRLEDRVLAKE